MNAGELGAWLGLRLIGAVCGTALSLAFMPPGTWRGLALRTLAALIGGVVFASEVRERAGLFGEEGVIAGACLAALFCWPAMGVAMKLLRNYRDPRT